MIKAKQEEILIEMKDLLELYFDKQNAKDISIQFDFNPINPY